MTLRQTIVRLAITYFLALSAITAGATGSEAETKIRFTLDWLPGSYHAPCFIALYQGYYKAEGLDVTIDRGKGSGTVVRQLATGCLRHRLSWHQCPDGIQRQEFEPEFS